MDVQAERALRAEIFAALDLLVNAKGGALTKRELQAFTLNGERLPLMDQGRGIRTPKGMSSALSIMSKPDSQYTDEVIGESLHTYAYADTAPDKGDNPKLRASVDTQLPMIFLRWITVDGVRYVPIYPVYAVHDDLPNRRIIIALDEKLRDVGDPMSLTPVEKRYAQHVTEQRLHQPQFRSQVLIAYEKRCAVCRLGRPELLEAAHIIPDRASHGTAEIPNGLSLCRIHHTAFDTNLMGISPDLKIHIGPALASADDEGPILEFALKGLGGAKVTEPRKPPFRPSRDRLAERFEEFLSVSTRLAGMDFMRTRPVIWTPSQNPN